ncbi:hypothetical protein V6N12_075949 [Hibiscus sabdariffa]|uniref:Uncharacterized protein n=1 Tax=Hibiscus sabdariffa TaxID=183260 RepID=A0ABR2AXX8_9ROSI
MHPAAGTGYEIAGPLEAFNTPIDGKGKELSIIGRQWKIVIQGRNSKVFIDLRFSSNNWLDFQPLKNILIRGSGVGLIEIGIIIRISRCFGGCPPGGVLDLRPGIQLLKYWMLSWLGGLARPKLDIDRLALDPLDRADIEADWHVPKKGDRRPRLKPLPTFRLRRNSGLRSYSEGCQDISIFDFIFRSIIKFLRPLAYGSGQAVLPFTLFEGLNSRDEKKGEWEIVRKLSIRSNSICRIREPLVKKGSLYTLQQKRLLTESHPSLPSFSSQDNEQTSGILYPTRREMQRALARFGLRAYACFTRAMRMRVTKALGLSSWSCLLGVCCFPCLSLLAIEPSRKH